jgi:hypothetical protein
MKRHRLADARITSSNCLGHTCGTNIDTEGIDFTNKKPHLTYIDKVFSFNQDTSCPLLFNLNTGGENADDFQVKLLLDGCDCSNVPCTLTRDAVFEIDNTFVVVEYFNTRPPGNIIASQITLNGFPVDAVSFSNGQYTAKTANVLSRIQKDRCLDKGLPTKVFFLINNVGPWDFRATYVLEGTVTTGGRLCKFRAEISNTPDSPNTSLPPSALSNFAIRNLSLPCAINGIAPDINFQFNARINLVNPRLVVNCETCPPPIPVNGVEGEQEETKLFPPFPCYPCPPCPPVVNPLNCTVSLVTALAIEPEIHVETVRRTLFCLNACEGLQPCQGSVVAAEIEDDIEECIIGGVDRPDCCCCDDSKDFKDCDDSKEHIRDIIKHKSRCEESPEFEDDCFEDDCFEDDCFEDDRFEDKRFCRKDREDVEDVRRIIRKNKKNDDEEDVRERIRKKRRTAFQFHGSNGCSW